MSTDPAVFNRLYLAQVGPDAIKQALASVPVAQSKFDPRPFKEALSCCVCFSVPKHFRELLCCINGHFQGFEGRFCRIVRMLPLFCLGYACFGLLFD